MVETNKFKVLVFISFLVLCSFIVFADDFDYERALFTNSSNSNYMMGGFPLSSGSNNTFYVFVTSATSTGKAIRHYVTNNAWSGASVNNTYFNPNITADDSATGITKYFFNVSNNIYMFNATNTINHELWKYYYDNLSYVDKYAVDPLVLPSNTSDCNYTYISLYPKFEQYYDGLLRVLYSTLERRCSDGSTDKMFIIRNIDVTDGTTTDDYFFYYNDTLTLQNAFIYNDYIWVIFSYFGLYQYGVYDFSSNYYGREDISTSVGSKYLSPIFYNGSSVYFVSTDLGANERKEAISLEFVGDGVSLPPTVSYNLSNVSVLRNPDDLFMDYNNDFIMDMDDYFRRYDVADYFKINFTYNGDKYSYIIKNYNKTGSGAEQQPHYFAEFDLMLFSHFNGVPYIAFSSNMLDLQINDVMITAIMNESGFVLHKELETFIFNISEDNVLLGSFYIDSDKFPAVVNMGYDEVREFGLDTYYNNYDVVHVGSYCANDTGEYYDMFADIDYDSGFVVDFYTTDSDGVIVYDDIARIECDHYVMTLLSDVNNTEIVLRIYSSNDFYESYAGDPFYLIVDRLGTDYSDSDVSNFFRLNIGSEDDLDSVFTDTFFSISNIFPDADSLSKSDRLRYMFVTFIVTVLVMLILGISVGNVSSKVVVYLGGFLVLFEVIFFTVEGYMSPVILLLLAFAVGVWIVGIITRKV